MDEEINALKAENKELKTQVTTLKHELVRWEDRLTVELKAEQERVKEVDKLRVDQIKALETRVMEQMTSIARIEGQCTALLQRQVPMQPPGDQVYQGYGGYGGYHP